ncbi:Swi3-domain-containing protein [Coniophora puteana RWD-64-598 SS2]|uniref:Chromosome segregation in meiosis protein n=1 Tax=Coniophora puteana (strain RWD-64-598) TaxID=741705 RepID=A0A5M3N169_CONPW|nr:Swi3-domain-containing protein [Coniophora puteana RWD-64-598 SS2]EIW85142.1 Swi3-domain-containing protein [Coniophora puteana RWD-64-598 SS2]
MSVALDDIWDAPVSPSPQSTTHHNPGSIKRPSLFLSDSEDETPSVAKRASKQAVAPRSEIDAMFDDLDDEGGGTTLEPLAPSLDMNALKQAAAAKHSKRSMNTQSGSSQRQILPSSSPARGNDLTDNENGNQRVDKEKETDGKKSKRKLAKLDEGRLLGPDGFPQLIRDTKHFQARGKGHEMSDLGRLLRIYQFWTHKMHPKGSFKDNVEKVEKVCHSKRMQVALSVWRDEAKGLVNGKRPDDEPLEIPEEDGDEVVQTPAEDRRSSNPTSPPSSIHADNDFDIDEVIRQEEERLKTIREPPAKPSHQPSTSKAVDHVMDVDDADMWAELDGFADPFEEKAGSSKPASDKQQEQGDEEMWDIVHELEVSTEPEVLEPTTVLTRSKEGETGMSNRIVEVTGTNDADWDDMYL